MNRESILVVDDQPQMLHAVQRVLASAYSVICCRTPGEAIAEAEKAEPDVALLDLRMPEMSGFELMDRLKQRRPKMDVIFMTGSINELDAQLVRAIEGGAFYFIQKPFDRKVLLALIGRCVALRRLAATNQRYTTRLEDELAQARAFQRSMLPAERAAFDGIDVHAHYAPCDELGGDFFDYVRIGPGRAAFLIADVTGHGVSAAMLTGMVKSAFHAAHDDDYEPLIVIRRMLAGIRPFGTRRFITAICARITLPERQLEFVNAGHPAGLIWRTSGWLPPLEDTGPLVGASFDDSDFERGSRALAGDERLLLYTDGVTDLESGGEYFGLERIVAEVERGRSGLPIAAILSAGRAFIGGAAASDDLTLLGIALG